MHTSLVTKLRIFKHTNLLYCANLLFRLIFNNKALLFHFLITFFSASLQGQSPLWLHNSGAVEATHIVINDSFITVGGSFQQELQGQVAKGGSDLFLYQYNEAAQIIRRYYLGGAKTEQWQALATSSKGWLYGVGSFKDSLFAQAKTPLLYQKNSSIFIGQWQADLSLNWLRSLRSTGLVQVLDAKSDSAGALYVTGSFQDSLFLDQAPPLVAPCFEAPFILKLDAQGTILWGKTCAACQGAQGKTLALDGQGQLYWAGEFRGQFRLDSAFSRAHPVYRDLFLVTLDAATGQQRAQKQFSGVYDNQCTALEWQDSFLYLAGHFRGLLYFDSVLLRTGFKTFSNAYVVQLDAQGRAQWGRQTTAFAEAECLDLALSPRRVYLCGSYRDSIQWGKAKAGAVQKTEAFQLSIGSNNQYAELITGQGEGFDVARGVAVDPSGAPWVVGGFQKNIRLGDSLELATGFSDGFVWPQWPYGLVLVNGVGTFPPMVIPEVFFPVVQLSPNPAKDSCIITILGGGTLERWELYHRKERNAIPRKPPYEQVAPLSFLLQRCGVAVIYFMSKPIKEEP